MGDLVDLAVAAAAPVERRAGGEFGLSTGRVVRIEVPVPLSAEEVLELLVALPGGIAQLNAQVLAAGRIALPDGSVRPVPRDA